MSTDSLDDFQTPRPPQRQRKPQQTTLGAFFPRIAPLRPQAPPQPSKTITRRTDKADVIVISDDDSVENHPNVAGNAINAQQAPPNPPVAPPPAAPAAARGKKRKRQQPQPKTPPVDSNLLPFWNNDVATLADLLWLPSHDDPTVNLHSTTWFRTTATTSKQPLRQKLSIDEDILDQWLLTTEGGPDQVKNPDMKPKKRKKKKKKKEKPNTIQATRKVRIYPNEEQKDKLRRWFGTARWTYNRCLDEVKSNRCRPNRSGGLREAVINDDNYVNRDSWVLDCPRDIRAGAYNDLIEAYKSNFAKQRINPQHKFDIHYRSRKDPQESIYVDKRAYKGQGLIYVSKFGNIPFRSSEPLPVQLHHDARLVRSYLDHYYFCYSVDVHVDENQVQEQHSAAEPRIAAIDPGVRTPFTVFDPSGKLIEYGRGDIGLLYRLCHYLDQLRSKIDCLRQNHPNSTKSQLHRKRWRMRRAWRRASRRVRNLVDELHKQVIHQLVHNYDVVLLPKLEVSRLVIKKARKIRSKTARAMVTWSHYRFRQRLLWKCSTTGCKVAICGEAYTSKTCGKCGWIHQKLGGNKVFKCGQCGIKMDRDANGSRNINLKNASRFGFRVEAALGLTPFAATHVAAMHGPGGLKLRK